MIRTLLAFWLLRLVHRLMPDIGPPMTAPVLPTPLELPERYVRGLVDLQLARADGVLGYMLGNPQSGLMYGAFTKTPDVRWRQ